MDAASRWVVLRGKLVAAQISASDIERREVENASRMDTTLSRDFRPSSGWRPASRFISRIQSRNTGHGNGVATAKQSQARATQCAGDVPHTRSLRTGYIERLRHMNGCDDLRGEHTDRGFMESGRSLRFR